MNIRAEGISVDLGGVTILREVALSVAPGEMVGLIGPNGAGKTTLLRTLARLCPHRSGIVLFDGRPASDFKEVELAQRIAYLAQTETVCWPLSVERVVALGRLPHRQRWHRVATADLAAIEHAMQVTAVSQFRTRSVGSLSGGERMRVLLARALAVQAQVLLVDEPIAALDPHHQLQIMELLRQQARQGCAIVAVLHDLTAAARFCDRLVLLDKGALVASGAPAAVLSERVLSETYRISAVRGECSDGLVSDGMYVVPWRCHAGVDSEPPGAEPSEFVEPPARRAAHY